jgi:hypothetical protein
MPEGFQRQGARKELALAILVAKGSALVWEPFFAFFLCSAIS